jgi:UDP-2,3-diacylglucosamine hydrolase
MATLFISDLHLSGERPHKLELFCRLLRGPVRAAHALYILGDLFEAWIGDDDRAEPHARIVAELADCCAHGGRVLIMRGNRDFLLGRDFERATGCALLPDPSVIDLHGRRTLLMHGDTLCTLDWSYQRYRSLAQHRLARAAYLAMPYALRSRIAAILRNLSMGLTRRKPRPITDVHQPAVEEALRDHDATLLIHGHTHRPGRHRFLLDGREVERIVLGDWYERDSVLVATGERLELLPVEVLLKASSGSSFSLSSNPASSIPGSSTR